MATKFKVWIHVEEIRNIDTKDETFEEATEPLEAGEFEHFSDALSRQTDLADEARRRDRGLGL